MANSNIILDDVSCVLDGVPVLQSVSVDLVEKRIAIIGRNGSGKSTLARIMCGLTAPSQGHVLVGGVDVFNDRKAALKTIGILFQNPDHQIIFPTVGEELTFGLRQLGYTKAAASEKMRGILATFGKDAWIDKNVITLSQGQRQLVCLMALLVMEPKVLVLDEPFSGLDIPTTRALSAILDDLDQTIVHITHDPQIATAAERVIWIENGRISADGPPNDIVAMFMAAMTADSGL